MADEVSSKAAQAMPDKSMSPWHASLITRDNVLFLIAVLAIFVATIYIRTPLLNQQGFYEPDGFYHFSVIRSAVNHGFVIPKVLGISGWPANTPVTEPDGLYWVTLVPYALLQFFGVSYYTVMRLVPLLFALLDIVGAYYLARFISKDRIFGLLVMAFVGLNAGDAARTSALIYRGDGFVTIFLILALIFIGLIINEKRRNRKLLYMFLGGFALSLGDIVWNGASFAVAVYVLSFLVISIFAFITDKKDLLRDMGYVLASLAIWYLLANAYILLGYMYHQTFTGLYFIGLWFALLVGWLIVAYLNNNQNNYAGIVGSALKRSLVIIALIIIGSVVFVVFEYGFIQQVFIANGFVITSGFAATIQELTPPTFGFLFASFNIALFMSPMTAIMAISSIVQGYVTLFWLVLLIGFVPYLFIRIYDSKGWLGGRARLIFDPKPELLIIIAYFALTAYLQMAAIRFNSLVSIPLAIFSAYMLYLVLLMVRNLILRRYFADGFNASTMMKLVITSVVLPVIIILLMIILNIGGILEYAIIGLSVAFVNIFIRKRFGTGYTYAAIATAMIVIILMIILIWDMYFGTYAQADFINPLFLNATTWLKTNTPINSVVLTLWPDGSVVEGWGNRTSVTDSVGSQNGTKADAFAAWLLNSSSDPAFLESSINGYPNYLLVRNIWLEESQGIFIESGINSSLGQYYGYAPLTNIYESANRSSDAVSFKFSNSGINAYLYTQNGIVTDSFLAYTAQNGQQELSPFSYVALYNQNNGNFSIQPVTAYNKTNGEMLFVMYSQVPSTQLGLPVNVTTAAVFAPGMADSNMLKLIYFCNSNQCEWNYGSKTAKLSLVYFNPDTKIFKITYNSTNGTST